MSERMTLRLFNAQQGYQAIKAAWQYAKALTFIFGASEGWQ